MRTAAATVTQTRTHIAVPGRLVLEGLASHLRTSRLSVVVSKGGAANCTCFVATFQAALSAQLATSLGASSLHPIPTYIQDIYRSPISTDPAFSEIRLCPINE